MEGHSLCLALYNGNNVNTDTNGGWIVPQSWILNTLGNDAAGDMIVPDKGCFYTLYKARHISCPHSSHLHPPPFLTPISHIPSHHLSFTFLFSISPYLSPFPFHLFPPTEPSFLMPQLTTVDAGRSHPSSTPLQYTLSIHPCNTPSQYTLPVHPLNPPSRHTLSIHPLNTPSQSTL